MTEEERQLYKEALRIKNRTRFSRKNINEYVVSLLEGKEKISVEEIAIESKRDLIRIIFISLYGHSAKSDYIVKTKEEIISSQGFRFRDFEIKRRSK